MSKNAFEKIKAGLDDALAYTKGETEGFRVTIPEAVDVRAIRQRLSMSQSAFAFKYGFSVGRIRDWEQGRYPIDPPSRILLTIIDQEPEAVERALSKAA